MAFKAFQMPSVNLTTYELQVLWNTCFQFHGSYRKRILNGSKVGQSDCRYRIYIVGPDNVWVTHFGVFFSLFWSSCLLHVEENQLVEMGAMKHPADDGDESSQNLGGVGLACKLRLSLVWLVL